MRLNTHPENLIDKLLLSEAESPIWLHRRGNIQ